MTRLGTLISCAVFGVGAALLGCGSSGSGGGAGGTGVGGAGGGEGGVGGGTSAGILDLIPRDNTIPDWTVDPANTNVGAGKVAATAADENTATVDLGLDGAARPFYENSVGVPTTLAVQGYVNSKLIAPAVYSM